MADVDRRENHDMTDHQVPNERSLQGHTPMELEPARKPTKSISEKLREAKQVASNPPVKEQRSARTKKIEKVAKLTAK